MIFFKKISLAICVLAFFPLGGRSAITQPLEFNHKIHKENKVECLDCHPYFKDHDAAGRPTLETCQTCHAEPIGKSDAEKQLIESIKTGKEIEWQRLYLLPRDVYFSHRRHVVLGDLNCTVCHDKIGEASKPPSRQINIPMKECLNCHKGKKASTDCIACHR